jgi:hypothetical protein
MTKVEELREPAYNDVAHYLFDCGHGDNAEKEATAEIDLLIAAARAEGIEAGLNRAKHWIASQVEREIPVISLPKDGLMDAVALTLSAMVELPKSYGDSLPIKEKPAYYAVGDNGQSGQAATSSGAYWKSIYVSPPEINGGE